MAESQNIEYKLTWRDEYLKWISGFANAQGGTIFIGKQDDGELPENWTIETLRKEHPSKPHNPDLANVFFRAGLIESWGRGIEKIVKECIAHEISAPDFEYEASSFKFYLNAENLLREISANSSRTKTEKTSGKTSGKILTYIKENNEITIPELAQLIGITERSVERNIQKLQELQNKLIRVGGAKGGFWEIPK